MRRLQCQSRRRFIGQLGVAGFSAGSWMTHGAAGGSTVAGDQPATTARAALQRLLSGNQRFVTRNTMHPHESKSWRDRLRGEQHPLATILACSDSRVAPELLFDQGFGDLFTIRVAGNVIAPDILGSIEYAIAHLHTRLLVVLGHGQFGAVTAAVDARLKGREGFPWINDLVDRIAPGLEQLDWSAPRESLIAQGVEANVRWSLRQCEEFAGFRELLDRYADAMVVGAIYDLETGRVRSITGIELLGQA